jgi:hypothetical protein
MCTGTLCLGATELVSFIAISSFTNFANDDAEVTYDSISSITYFYILVVGFMATSHQAT